MNKNVKIAKELVKLARVLRSRDALSKLTGSVIFQMHRRNVASSTCMNR